MFREVNGERCEAIGVLVVFNVTADRASPSARDWAAATEERPAIESRRRCRVPIGTLHHAVILGGAVMLVNFLRQKAIL